MVIRIPFLPVRGMALHPSLVLVREHDAALLAHEMVHCQQMRAVGVLRFWWAYLTSRSFRMAAEVEAYRVQLVRQPWRLDSFAKALSSIYLLGITQEEARKALAD